MKRVKINPVTTPAGLTISIDGQHYTVVGNETYPRQNGETGLLICWQAECATCGEGFIAKSLPDHWPSVRRCLAHRQPGKRVRRVRVEIVEP